MGRLFLDTARMGLAAQATVDATAALSRYWAANALAAEFDQFLNDGYKAATEFQRYPALANWHGIAELKQQLLSSAGLGAGWRTLLAGRSSKLLELPIRILKQHKHRILCFQSLWPRYSKMLSTDSDIVIFNDRKKIDECDLVDGACDMYASMGCRAIVLPAVTHLGRVMPYADILELLLRSHGLDMGIVDGAQEFGHMPLQEIGELPVFYVTCSQKWLRSGLNAGIAFVSPQIDWTKTREQLKQTDDPLLQFVCGSGAEDCFGETVAVSPLIALRAAIDGLTPEKIKQNFRVRMSNRLSVKNVLRIYETIGTYRAASGILVYALGEDPPIPSSYVRKTFLEMGIVLSAFPIGFVRLSMPEVKLTNEELFKIVECCDDPRIKSPN